MSLFGRKEKQELEFLRSQMTPQQLEAADLAMKIKSAREELADITAKIAKESSALSKLKKQVNEYDVIKQNIDSILRQDKEPEREKGTERG